MKATPTRCGRAVKMQNFGTSKELRPWIFSFRYHSLLSKLHGCTLVTHFIAIQLCSAYSHWPATWEEVGIKFCVNTNWASDYTHFIPLELSWAEWCIQLSQPDFKWSHFSPTTSITPTPTQFSTSTSDATPTTQAQHISSTLQVEHNVVFH